MPHAAAAKLAGCRARRVCLVPMDNRNAQDRIVQVSLRRGGERRKYMAAVRQSRDENILFRFPSSHGGVIRKTYIDMDELDFKKNGPRMRFSTFRLRSERLVVFSEIRKETL